MPTGAEEREGPRPWFFDLWSTVYDLSWVQTLAYRPVHDAIVMALSGRPPRNVLDVGCGTGLLTARIASFNSGARVVGCDFSLGMLRHAAGRHTPVSWVQGNALRLPFQDHGFDTVVSTEAFHWFPDQRIALGEMFRVLEPGGRLLIAGINPPFELLSLAFRYGSRFTGEPFNWPTRRRMRRWLEGVGFRVTVQRGVFRWPGWPWLPAVLSVAERPNRV